MAVHRLKTFLSSGSVNLRRMAVSSDSRSPSRAWRRYPARRPGAQRTKRLQARQRPGRLQNDWEVTARSCGFELSSAGWSANLQLRGFSDDGDATCAGVDGL